MDGEGWEDIGKAWYGRPSAHAYLRAWRAEVKREYYKEAGQCNHKLPSMVSLHSTHEDGLLQGQGLGAD